MAMVFYPFMSYSIGLRENNRPGRILVHYYNQISMPWWRRLVKPLVNNLFSLFSFAFWKIRSGCCTAGEDNHELQLEPEDVLQLLKELVSMTQT